MRRVAIVGDTNARDRLAALLGDRVVVVPATAAQAAIVDAPDETAIASFLEELAGPPAIVLVDDPSADVARVAFRSGAAAILARQSDAGEIIAAIDAVIAGLLVFDASARDAFSAPTIPRTRTASVDALTERERAVLDLLARGLSNKRIAVRLNISEHTVKFHVGSVLAKLGAQTRAEAVALGVRLGYVIV